MVDQESVDAHYARMIASLSEGNVLDTDPAVIQTSVLTAKVEEIETLHKDDTIEIDLNLEPPQISQPPFISEICIKSKSVLPKILERNCNSNGFKNRTIPNKLQNSTKDANLQIPVNFSKSSELSNIISFFANSLPPSSTNNTAVEQPNIGPCSCFICGHILVDPGERYSYSKTQKLFYMQMPLLQLLSDIVNQTVVTNTEDVDLCNQCSETMNEVDMAYKHLKDLKQDIIKLFNLNSRPKLTFHVLHNSQKKIPTSKNIIVKNNTGADNNSVVSLEDLVLSRPKRGRCAKKYSKIDGKSHEIPSISHSKKKFVKRKGGRPRKPYQCKVCKRKFLAEGMMHSHMKKEHNHSVNFDNFANGNSNIKEEDALILDAIKNVKSEHTEANSEHKSGHARTTMESEFKQLIIPRTTQLPLSLTASPILKSSFLTFENFNNLSKLNSTMRPIQPKPQTLIQTTTDGSVLLYMNPTDAEAPPTLIKVSHDYLNLQSESLICEICKKSFLDDKSYRMHRISVHGMKKRKQDISNLCSKMKKTDKYSKDYCERGFSCCHCNSIYPSKSLLAEHKIDSHSDIIKNVRKEKLYNCEECDKAFFFKYEYETHIETHLPFNQVGPHEFLCCVCGLKVASKASLKIHLHKFHDKPNSSKEYLCSTCGYLTGSKKTFSDHMRNHNEVPEPKTRCYLCEKEMLYSSFKTHMLRMHGEAKYPCESCDQKFSTRSELMKHINNIHSSFKPYDCTVCGKKFLTTEVLRYHKNKIHFVEFRFCNTCGKSFKSMVEYKNHFTWSHCEVKTKFACLLCSKIYTDNRRLKNHMSTAHKEKNIATEGCKPQENPPSSIHIEFPSSLYESQRGSFSPTEAIISTNQTTTAETVSQMLNPIIETYQHPENESMTITTLQSHIPEHHSENPFIHIEDPSNYSQSHQDQSLDSHVDQNQEQHHATLSQYAETLPNIHSIYLVSESVCIQ